MQERGPTEFLNQFGRPGKLELALELALGLELELELELVW